MTDNTNESTEGSTLTSEEEEEEEAEEKARKLAKAERLNNWAPFNFHRWSTYPEVNKAVNAIYKNLKTDPSFTGQKKVRKKNVKVIVLDVYAKHLINPEMYTGIYLRKDEYRAGSRYNAIHLSELTPTLVKKLHSDSYLELEKGVNGRDGKHDSYMTRIRATRKLLDLIDDHHWTEEMLEDARDRECIELRKYDPDKDKQVPVKYCDTPETVRMRESLTKYNNLIRYAHIDVLGFPSDGIKKTIKVRGKVRTWVYRLDRSKKFTRRIFNNGTWDNGGRFYGGWWQQVPNSAAGGAWRSRIYIMGNPTIEIDYSGLHIVLLYAEKGIDYWKVDDKDPYSLPGYDENSDLRQLLKLLLLIAVNVQGETEEEQRKKVLGAIYSEINSEDSGLEWVYETDIDLNQVIDDFELRHAPIADRFFTGAGKTLQLLDSKMAEYVINKMTEEHRPVLAIHDSFICEKHLYPALLEHVEHAFTAVISEVYPGLAESMPNLKFVTPTGELSRSYFSLPGRAIDKWKHLGTKARKKDKAFMARLKAYNAKRPFTPPDYYTTEKQDYVVPEDDVS